MKWPQNTRRRKRASNRLRQPCNRRRRSGYGRSPSLRRQPASQVTRESRLRSTGEWSGAGWNQGRSGRRAYPCLMEDTSRYQLEVTLPDNALAAIRKGTAARVELDPFAGDSIADRVAEMEVGTDPASHTVRARV